MYATYGPALETNPTDWMNEEVSTGTSIMAVEYDGGVVIGADSRTTMGSYISNAVCNKLGKITENVYVCRSGSAADTQAISDAVSYRLNMLSMEIGEPVSVKTAANDFRQICYSYRDSLMVGIIIAGWDRKNGGQVYSVPLGGMLTREKCCIGGSGSAYIYGFIDENFKRNMTQEECVNFVAKGLGHAMWRDGSSGGVIRINVINEKGVTKHMFSGDSVPEYYQ